MIKVAIREDISQISGPNLFSGIALWPPKKKKIHMFPQDRVATSPEEYGRIY